MIKSYALKRVQCRLVNIVYSVTKYKRPYINSETGNVPLETA